MKQLFVFITLLSCWFGAIPLQLSAQINLVEEQSKVYLVLMDLESGMDVSMCYSKRFDKELAKIEFVYEDTINQLEEMSDLEEALTGPECFVPEIKLVYKYYTYVISLHCSKVIKYRNQTPWFTSPTRLKNDLILTPSVYTYLNRLRVQYFGPDATNEEQLKGMATIDPLDDMTDFSQELDWLLNEDGLEDDDSDLDMEEDQTLPDEDDDMGEMDEDDDGWR